MAFDRSSSHNNQKRQSIPLQDLSPPPDQTPESNEGWSPGRGSRRGKRTLLGHRQSFSGRVNTAYERVNEGSPPAPIGENSGLPHVTTPRNAHQPPAPYEDGEVSPVNAENFQAAMGSVGLSFEPPGPSRPPPGKRRSTLNVITENDAVSTYSLPTSHLIDDAEQDTYFSPQDTDRTPLTDSRFLQPIAFAGNPGPGLRAPPPSAGHSRSGSRLGDDLPQMEAGIGRPASTMSTKSLSPSSASNPLSRAGTILRKASQRVVNLSNEPDTIENSLRRERSIREARMEEPPTFPAMQDYAHDERSSPPLEKAGPLVLTNEPSQPEPNPLRGKSLLIFSPDNWIRLKLCEMLVHPATEPVILILIVVQTILLAVDSAKSIKYTGNTTPKAWEASWINFALLALFSIYTVEIIARIIVSGLIKNADEYSTLDIARGFRAALTYRVRAFFAPQTHLTMRDGGKEAEQQPSILRSFTGAQLHVDQPGHSRQQQRVRLARRAFLRHGFNRLDFVAVVSFWIMFILSVLMVEGNRRLFLFRMLSCLRILRLLGLTSGTSVILRSLKKAAPMLVNVAFLIGFFWLLFAIIGVQAFKSSLKRTCVWYPNATKVLLDPVSLDNQVNIADSYNRNDPNNVVQFCGGYISPTNGSKMPWLKADLIQNGTGKHKGYLCPQNSLCVEGTGPYNGTVSFDNIFQSLELVFVVMSANTFSDLLYYCTDTDFLAGALFFAFGIVVMSLWLMNLLVAVITSSFQVIREESKTSAFTIDEQDHFIEEEEGTSRSRLKRAYDMTYWLWIVIILFDLFVMCLRSSDMSQGRQHFIDETETIVACVLVFEILLRFIADWRNFHKSQRNWIDLSLAIITAVIQIPHIHDSGEAYEWLTFFQIIRIYRVVLAVSLTRELIKKVLGNVSGLLNLIVFVFLITFLTAIFAVQIFRGQFPDTDIGGSQNHITFSDIYNGFIGMYQVLSSENWTILLYNSTQYELVWNQAWIGAIFFISWFILANFVVLNMFIAVIQENFDVSEDEKRLQQVKAFLQQKELGGSSQGNLSLSTIFRLGRDTSRHKDPLDFGPATMEMLLQEAVFRDFLDEHMEPVEELHEDDDPITGRPVGHVKPGLLSVLWGKLLKVFSDREPNPFYSRLQFSRGDEVDIRTRAREVVSATEQRKRAQRQYLQRHPTYNVSLFVFGPRNPIRRLCQGIVGPGRGSQRFDGINPVKPVWYAFSAFIYATIVAMVLLACVSTPLYQREYFLKLGHYTSRNWFVWTDMGFACVFTLEALIKVIADGFFWTPNAYFRGSWGLIDGLVLVTLWINVITSLYSDGAVSRAVGAFKALRALRLLNVSDSARDTFHSVIVLGIWKVISAAFVSLSLLFPFAIYGLNLFNGRMRSCNDSTINFLDDCVGEFNSTPFNWNVLGPRQSSNPYYNFDNFGSSLSILFQIVSQEGWTDVMWTAMSSGGRGVSAVQYYQSQGNAVFFIAFNLLGAVFVLTLFVSVFMRNYTEQTGVAYLTADQRSWLELRKLLRQISPSKRPSSNSESGFRGWCYRIAVKKHGRWQRLLTTILFLHLVLLVTEFYPEPYWWQRFRDYVFLAFTVVYIANVLVRIVGLTWKRFRRSSWDLYSVLSITGTVITTLLDLSKKYKNGTYSQLHKLFLVSIALLLIPRNNQLDQLFKTAAASLSAIGNLLATWFVLFLVYAIALTQTFGLTRFGDSESGNRNFRNVPKALILLFRMSMGEGWNQIMEDFATINPPNCVTSPIFYKSDCGSAGWARALFISWNILSMYIFVSLFVSLIFESFSYVYQRSSGLAVINRKELRRFKQAWATYDPEGTGWISKDVFPRLLGELSGAFEMRIYAGSEQSVHRILENCAVETRGNETPPPGVIHGIDLARLNHELSKIDVVDIRRRRIRMEIFFQEIMVSAHPDRGINFTSCLMILAHYNVISDNKSLRLEEYLRRRARLQRVEEEVRRRVVKGFFDMMFWSRQFRSRLDFRHSARMVNIPQFAVPEIFVDDQDAMSPQDPATPGPFPSISEGSPRGRPSLDTSGLRHRGDSGSPSRSDNSSNVSPSLAPQRDIGHSPSPSGDSAFQWGYDGAGDDRSPVAGRSRANSSVDRQNVLDTFDNSAWGESIRRSFTTRRTGTRAPAPSRTNTRPRGSRRVTPDPPR